MFVPPVDMRLKAALVTSFSLDFLVLGGVLAALAGHDVAALKDDPVQISRGAMALGDRVAVLAQKGKLRATHKERNARLYALCSKVVREVRLDRRLFHPKLAFLLFEGEGLGKRTAPFVRVVCGSRNLTRERGWEMGVVLEGTLGGRKTTLGTSLAAAASRLSTLARDLPPKVRSLVKDLETFELSMESADAFGAPRFHLQGAGGADFAAVLDTPARRVFAMSPFLSDATVMKLIESSDELTLVSTRDALDALDSSTHAALDLDRTYVVDPLGAEDVALSLHAKVIVREGDSESRAFVGSANLTTSGWSRGRGGNWEALVELPKGLRIKGLERDFLFQGDRGGKRNAVPALSPWIQRYALPSDDARAAAREEQQEETAREEREQAAGSLELEGRLDGDVLELRASGTEQALDVLRTSLTIPQVRMSIHRQPDLWFDAHPWLRGEAVRIPIADISDLSDLVWVRCTPPGHRECTVLVIAQVPDLEERRRERDAAILKRSISDEQIGNFLRAVLSLPGPPPADDDDEPLQSGADEPWHEPGGGVASDGDGHQGPSAKDDGSSPADEQPAQSNAATAAAHVRRRGSTPSNGLPPICFENFLEAYVRAPRSLDEAKRMLTYFPDSPDGRRWLAFVNTILEADRHRRESA